MKKVIVLLALVAVGALVFAETAPAADYSFSASVTAKWQYDLESNQSGFTNESDVSFKFNLLNGLSKSKGAEEGTYGLIEVSNIYLGINEIEEATAYDDNGVVWGPAKDADGDNLSVKAKIVSGNLWVGLGKGAYQADYNNASYVPLFDADDGWDNDSAFNPEIKPAGSIQIGYKLGDLGEIAAVIGSKSAGAVNDTDQYTIGFDATIKPVKDVLTIVGGFWYDMELSEYIATAKASVTAGDLSASAAIDYASAYSVISVAGVPAVADTGCTNVPLTVILNDGEDVNFDIAASLAYSLFEAKDKLSVDFYYTKAVGNEGGTSANSTYYNVHQGDIGVKFVDAEGLVPGLGFTVFAGLNDLLDEDLTETLMSFAGSVNYKVALSDATYVKPSIAVRKDMAGAALLYYKADLEAVLFPNTTFNVTLEGRTEGNDANFVLVKSDDLPMLTVAAKISL